RGRAVRSRAGRSRRSGGCRGTLRGARAALGGGAADPEDAGVEVLRLLERDLDRADERVPLLGGVVGDHGLQLLGQGLLPLAEPLVVGGSQLDDEGAGYDSGGAA